MWFKRWLLLLGMGLILVGCAAPGSAASTPTPPAAELPSTNQIVVDAVIMPERTVELYFEQNGTVAEVLADEGQDVAAQAPLARLKTQALELQLAKAKAQLSQAQAAYAMLMAGASETTLAAQEAAVRQSLAQLERSQTGNLTAADRASAQAQLRAAQAQLDALRTPSAASRSAAQLRVTQAEQQLAATQSNASAQKTNAELAMRQATDALTQAQARYATAKSNWQYIQETGADPANPSVTDPATGKKKKNTLNEVQRRQYYEAFVSAEAGLASAEKALQQAEVSYDQARQAEVTQITQAEASLADARQQLEALNNPTPQALASAQAAVEQARANLQKIQQGGTAADVAVAQAAVDQAQAQLAALKATPRQVEQAELQAQIEAAQIAVQQAEHQLAQATLLAPFAGVIAERHLTVGQTASLNQPQAPFVLADMSSWKIVTDNLNERDVVRIQPGDTAQIRVDALPDLVLSGVVRAIQPRGADRYGEVIYTVTIIPESWDARLRWNMSASVTVQINR